ncbi:MAG TPA: preprotein translocase subunit SecE [Bacteroidia bacterium]|jgi:preprotein translocase subunit SecE|nr:preprotein translocase subunit SecE [Bacteroidia bacterium]
MSKIRTYFEETTEELVKKTSWPTWQELQGSAMVVLVASVMIALLVFVMDSSFKKLMELAYQLLNTM